MKVGYLDDGEFGGKAQIHVIFGRDQMVVLIKADDAYDYLYNHQNRNYEKLRLQRLVMEESHAQKRTDRAADPSPEEQGFLGYAALAFFGAGFIYTIKEERDKVNDYKPVNENHVMSSKTPIIELPVRFCRFLQFSALVFRQNP